MTPAGATQRLGSKDAATAVLVAAIYGVSFVAIHISVNELAPLLVTGYRFLLTALPLIFFVKRPDVAIGYLAAYGLMQGTVMFGLIFTAISWGMPAGLSSLIVQLQVFFTIGFAAWMFAERPDARQLVGAGVGFGGIAVIGLAQAQSAALVPFLLVIASAAAWGAANIIAKLAKPSDMLSFVVYSSAFAPLPLFALSVVIEGTTFGLPQHLPSWPTIISVLFVAYVTTVWAFTLWVGLLNRHSAAAVTPFALLIPIFGIGAMALAFGERLSWTAVAGASIVFVGLAIAVTGRPKGAKTKYASH